MNTPAVDIPTYESVEKLIFSAIHSVWRGIGGDLDEMISYSGFHYWKAVQCYKPERGKSIEAWIRKVTWDDCYAARRTALSRAKRFAKGDIDLMAIADKARFNLNEVLEGLSEDAMNLVILALDCPANIAVRNDGIPKLTSFCAAAKRAFKWSDEQLQEVMGEIRECLNN